MQPGAAISSQPGAAISLQPARGACAIQFVLTPVGSTPGHHQKIRSQNNASIFNFSILFDSKVNIVGALRSSSDEEEILLLYAIAGSQQKRKRIWVHEINKKRENYGEYHRLCRELESHEDRFYLYFRMSQDSFEELYQLI
ncbi:hypothetical protein QTP88_023402 [Uroleucon formosanum]